MRRVDMLLAVDIGNSTAAFGLFPAPRSRRGLCVKKVPTKPAAAAEYRSVISGLLGAAGSGGAPLSASGETLHAVVSSVVPPVERVVLRVLRGFITAEALVVSSSLKTSLEFAVKRHDLVGTDR
ncbi:MAG TPA: type III pantothenate kinase, partial [Dissulfurispiraceae bacterium]|nr:type III pantothenate kinase [Dissulfurispiraceae bacterium]